MSNETVSTFPADTPVGLLTVELVRVARLRVVVLPLPIATPTPLG